MALVWVATAPIHFNNVLAFNPGNVVPDSVVSRFNLSATGLVEHVEGSVPSGPNYGVNPVTQAELDALISGANPALRAALVPWSTDWQIGADGGDLEFRLTGASDWAARIFDESSDFQVRGALIGQGFVNYGQAGLRIPWQNTVTVDGSTLGGTTGDKVGAANSVNFVGGFDYDIENGVANGIFGWGANDFTLTGTAAGDIDGLTDIQSRLTEVHLRTPGTTVNNVSGLVGESNVDELAVGATVTGWLASVIARGPQKRAPSATIANAAALLVHSPDAGTATEQWAIYASGDGDTRLGGNIEMNADPSAPKTLNAHYGGFKGVTLTLGEQTLVSAAHITAQAASTGDHVAWLRGRGGQSGDLLRLSENDNVLWTRFDKIGRLALGTPYAPASSEMNNGELFLTVDPTPGAMKLILTGKDSGGTVRSAVVALS